MVEFKHFILMLFLPLCLSGCGGTEIIDPVDPTPSPLLDPGNTMVIYEANERLFNRNGAIKDIEANLDRISSLGVNVIWLMPVNTQGRKEAFGSPYCVRDYTEVNPDYGTLADLKSLVSKAHSKGMKVILDWVANHTSWDNSWITEHPEWYTQEGGKIISPKGMGWNDVADLNYSNKEMRKAMIDAMCYWVKEADVDGFRCDYADGVPADFWKECIQSVRGLKSDALLLAESSNAACYGCGFDLLYAWDYAGRLPKLFTGNLTISTLFNTVKSEGQARIRYTFNHDTASQSSPAALYKSVEGELSAFVLTMFIGGVPMIYSSQEAGYDRTISFFDWVSIDWNSNRSITDSYQKLAAAYSASADVRCGEPEVVEHNTIAEIRYQGNDGEGLYVLVNTGSEQKQVKLTMEFAGKRALNLLTSQTVSLPTVEVLPPYGYSIYKILK